ncbi:cation symporter [Micractinium conductrix]|uniref:Cation symporter n=1 Tax=Micractinium conductrix TaxID=554055 RepID=A0A2P6V4G7_9CHLO|nr:cation symporter [Micractinium conductrix]|eukprot:PSC68974.1 cation symporter [Micractinium conductrix]
MQIPPQTSSIMTVGGRDYGPSPKTEYKVVQREQVANPGYTTALLQGANTAITEKTAAHFGMFYGGLAQFLAGMWEFKRQNTFGAAAFTSYGAFWMGFALLQILVAAKIFSVNTNADQMMLSLWGILTFIFMIGTLELNFCLSLLFFTLAVLFWLLAAGAESITWTRIGGWWGLVVAGIAWYIAAADVINEQYKRTVLPIGKWNVGVPMSKGLKRIMSKIPVIGWGYVKACNREDKAAGYGKFKAKEDELAGYPAEPFYRPYELHTTYSTPGAASWEGQAVSLRLPLLPQGPLAVVHVVRNPWDAVTSAFWFHMQDPAPPPFGKTIEELRIQGRSRRDGLAALDQLAALGMAGQKLRMPYAELLRTLPDAQGVQVKFWMASLGSRAYLYATARQYRLLQHRGGDTLQLRYEDAMSHFNATWTQVLQRFWPQDAELMLRKAQRCDSSTWDRARLVSNDHVTGAKRPPGNKERLQRALAARPDIRRHLCLLTHAMGYTSQHC